MSLDMIHGQHSHMRTCAKAEMGTLPISPLPTPRRLLACPLTLQKLNPHRTTPPNKTRRDATHPRPTRIHPPDIAVGQAQLIECLSESNLVAGFATQHQTPLKGLHRLPHFARVVVDAAKGKQTRGLLYLTSRYACSHAHTQDCRAYSYVYDQYTCMPPPTQRT